MVALNPMPCANPKCSNIIADSDDMDVQYWPYCKACGKAMKESYEQYAPDQQASPE